MSIDPFEAPPLVEWENCLTLTEIDKFLEYYTSWKKQLKWWEFRKKSVVNSVLQFLVGLEDYIHQKAQRSYYDY